MYGQSQPGAYIAPLFLCTSKSNPIALTAVSSLDATLIASILEWNSPSGVPNSRYNRHPHTKVIELNTVSLDCSDEKQ